MLPLGMVMALPRIKSPETRPTGPNNTAPARPRRSGTYNSAVAFFSVLLFYFSCFPGLLAEKYGGTLGAGFILHKIQAYLNSNLQGTGFFYRLNDGIYFASCGSYKIIAYLKVIRKLEETLSPFSPWRVNVAKRRPSDQCFRKRNTFSDQVGH